MNGPLFLYFNIINKCNICFSFTFFLLCVPIGSLNMRVAFGLFSDQQEDAITNTVVEMFCTRKSKVCIILIHTLNINPYLQFFFVFILITLPQIFICCDIPRTTGRIWTRNGKYGLTLDWPKYRNLYRKCIGQLLFLFNRV